MLSADRKLCYAAIFVAATFAVELPLMHFWSASSQAPIPSAQEKGRSKQDPASESQADSKQEGQGTNKSPFVVKTISTPETQAEADRDAAYQQQRTTDKHAIEIGIGAIIFGFLQTVALFFTFWTMRTTAIRQLRAYIKVTITLKSFSLTKPIEVYGIAENVGQTPAKAVELQGGIFVGAVTLDDNAKMPEPREHKTGRHGKSTLYPQAGDHMILTADEIITPTEAVMLTRNPPGCAIYAYGEVRYRDIFFIKRSTYFCVFIEPKDAAELIDAARHSSRLTREITFVSSHVMNDFT